MEFWSLSLREFVALLDRRNTERQALDRRTALVMWSIHRCLCPRKDGQPWKIEDFLPGEPAREQTPEEMLAIFQAIARDSGNQ